MPSLSVIEQRIEAAIHSVPEFDANAIAQQCGVRGITAAMVDEGKTPSTIARLWLNSMLKAGGVAMKSAEETPVEGWSGALLPYSKVVFEDIKAGHAEAWNFSLTLRTADDIDALRLREAVEKALDAHPVFACRISDDGRQHYERGYRTPYLHYDITQGEGFTDLHVTANRVLGDATSFGILLEDISRAYHGDALEHDNYLRYVTQYEAHQSTPEYLAHGERLAKRFGDADYAVRPATDLPLDTDVRQSTATYYDDYSDLAEALQSLQERCHMSLNATFSLATALAIMDYNNTDRAALTWAYVGRESMAEQRVFGSLHRDIPFRIRRTDIDTPQQLCRLAREEMQKGVMLSDYPFTFLTADRQRWRNAVNILLQPSLDSVPGTINWQILPPPSQTERPAYTLLDIEISESPLTLTYNYSSPLYSEESIRKFAELVRKNIRWLLGF